ncbi:MAG: STAS domain-containing protein [Leptospira sp.]|nr:STAS domain-containing protein [Leptospira sp.]
MNIEKKVVEDINIYIFEGRIDFHPYDLLDKSVLKDSFESQKKSVILDFTNLKYISSLGIRYIYDIKTELNKNNINLAISGASEAIIQVFKLLGLYETFSLFQKQEDAINHLKGKS